MILLHTAHTHTYLTYSFGNTGAYIRYNDLMYPLPMYIHDMKI